MARISEHAYLISTGVLLAICAISVLSRFYIRLLVQKEFSVDDAFLIIAVCCMLCAVVIMYTVTLDKMYLVQSLSVALPTATSLGFHIEDMPADAPFFQPVYSYLKWITVNQTLAWCAIMAVKFSFLFLFRRLIDRIPRLITYWWFVIAFNFAALVYGFSTYFVICPYYNDPRIYRCSMPSGVARLLRHGIAQTAMDVIGDLLIPIVNLVLYIPVNLIWKIQIRWTQKIPLVLSLCLTAIMILISITRVAGIRAAGGQIDSVWESYFLIVGAEIGIILASVSTYRALFVSHRKTGGGGGGGGGGGVGVNNDAGRGNGDQKGHFYSPLTMGLLKDILTVSPWRSRVREGGQSTPDEKDNQERYDGVHAVRNLPDIPRAHMTGVRTFINGGTGQGTETWGIMGSRISRDNDDDDISGNDWPFWREQHQNSCTNKSPGNEV